MNNIAKKKKKHEISGGRFEKLEKHGITGPFVYKLFSSLNPFSSNKIKAFFQAGCHTVAHADLELTMLARLLLPQPHKC